jgi:hypothetical protein
MTENIETLRSLYQSLKPHDDRWVSTLSIDPFIIELKRLDEKYFPEKEPDLF